MQPDRANLEHTVYSAAYLSQTAANGGTIDYPNPVWLGIVREKIGADMDAIFGAFPTAHATKQGIVVALSTATVSTHEGTFTLTNTDGESYTLRPGDDLVVFPSTLTGGEDGTKMNAAVEHTLCQLTPVSWNQPAAV